jgi:hypothetical protein
MNLANKPTSAELADLLARCDDKAASHVLWVTLAGDVHADPLPAHLSPAGFERQHEREFKFRCETFHRGNGYVGPTAAKDNAWVAKLFAELKHMWENDFKGYSDNWEAESLT